MADGCFGYGTMAGGYGYGWMLFSWLIGALVIVALALFTVWIAQKIHNENNEKGKTNKGKRRRK